MNRSDVESRIALAMLPLGAVMMLAAAIGVAGILALAADVAWHWPPHAGWWLGWSVAALAVAAIVMRKGIETMATFDWRVAVLPLTLSVAIVAAWPGFWLG